MSQQLERRYVTSGAHSSAGPGQANGRDQPDAARGIGLFLQSLPRRLRAMDRNRSVKGNAAVSDFGFLRVGLGLGLIAFSDVSFQTRES